MPRLSSTLLKRAHKVNPLLKYLLRTCRDVDSAKNELRWLREHVKKQSQRSDILSLASASTTSKFQSWQLKRLRNLCIQRGRGKPLQYILGTEHFGELEILCKPGVLIPRKETATLVTNLAHRLYPALSQLPEPVRVLDLCTGTACIPLLLSHLLPQLTLHAHCIDASPTALRLADLNLRRFTTNLPPHHRLTLARDDVLHPNLLQSYIKAGREWDVLICNPPYISSSAYISRETERSVRLFEPRMALVPPQTDIEWIGKDVRREDIFYSAVLRHALRLGTKLVVVEVGGWEQAVRVVGMAWRLGWEGVEVWRDAYGSFAGNREVEIVDVDDVKIKVRGGMGSQGRAVICWRGVGREWIADEDRNIPSI